jgi:proteasome lid subunit RPN8/RPN11
MCPDEVQLEVTARQAIEHRVRAAWPLEMVAAVGGQRVGRVLRIDQIVPFEGAGSDDGFVVPPTAFLAAASCLQLARAPWLGFVHSHPGGSPAPSARDRRELWRGCVQLIVGGARRDELQTAAFWLQGDTCTPLRLTQPCPEPAA